MRMKGSQPDPSTTPADRPIWLRQSTLRLKPAQSPYGFILQEEAHGYPTASSLAEAILKHQQARSIQHVWTPESETLILIEECPDLLPSLQPIRMAEAQDDLRSTRYKAVVGAAVITGIGIIEYGKLGGAVHRSGTLGIAIVVYLMFALVPYYQAYKALRTARKLSKETLAEEARDIRFDYWTEKQPGYFTKGLLAIIILLSALQFLSPILTPLRSGFNDTVQLAGLNKGAILAGEGWRIWTAPFLHGNWVHLFMNASALWYIGRRVEVLTKWPNLLLCYLISIIAGAYASYYFLPMGKSAVGASGGLMGLMGFLLVFELLHPRLAPRPARRRLIAGIVLTGVIGLLGYQFIDNAAHIGGLLAGIAYGYLGFRRSDTVQRPRLVLADYLIGGAALLILTGAALFTARKLLGW